MTKDQALKIKHWRVHLKLSWRTVANYTNILWPVQYPNYHTQQQGAELCDRAAILLGEDPASKAWNCGEVE